MTDTQNTEQDFDFGMTDLEEQLTAEDGATRKAETLNVLLSAGRKVKAAIDAGLPTEEFENAQKTYTGLAAAHEVIANFPAGTPGQAETS